MPFSSEWASVQSHKGPKAASPPSTGSAAPTTANLTLAKGRPAIIAFLRHCGCPFAEQSFLRLRKAALSAPNVDFYAVSHSDELSTRTWQKSLPAPPAGSEPSNLHVVVDEDLQTYAAWGLGASSFVHTLNPGALFSLIKVQVQEGIKVRPTQSGSRWQLSGYWGVDAQGIVRWGRVSTGADDVPDVQKGLAALGVAKA